MSIIRENSQVARTKNDNKGSEKKKLKFESQLILLFSSLFVAEQSEVHNFINLSKTNTFKVLDQKELKKLNILLKKGKTICKIFFILYYNKIFNLV